MLEISPVLSGQYDSLAFLRKANAGPPAAPGTSQIQQTQSAKKISSLSDAASVDASANAGAASNISSSSNINSTSDTQGTEDANGVDARRYTKFDRSAADAGSTTDFSFGDLLDLVNPLQHIPVASAVYRAVSGDKINPISRVAGDILYGAAFGVASAVIGGVGGAADGIIESQSGKDLTGNIVTSLLGPDQAKTATTQFAQATPSSQAASAVAASVAPSASPASQVASAAATASVPAASSQAASTVAAKGAASTAVPPDPSNALIAAASDPTKAGLMAPAPNKLPFGGAMVSNNMQQQNMDMALASASPSGMRIGHTLYTSRLMNGAHPLPVATTASTGGTPSAPTASAPTASAPVAAASTAPATAPLPATLSDTASSGFQAPATSSLAAPNTPDMSGSPASPLSVTSTSDNKTGPQKNPLPQSLVDDMMMLRALSQYKNVATGPQNTGTHVDVTN